MLRKIRSKSVIYAGLLISFSVWSQDAPFIDGEPLFFDSTVGVLRGPANHPVVGTIEADEIAVDQNGDGLVDTIYDISPEILTGSNFNLDFRLSPAQEVLYSRKFPENNFPVCNNDADNNLVFFHRLDTAPNTTSLASAVCLRGPISIMPLFFDEFVNPLVQTAVTVAAPPFTGLNQSVLWVDLGVVPLFRPYLDPVQLRF